MNLTLAIDDELLHAARKAALDRGTSVNQMVRDYLEQMVASGVRRQLARARLKTALAHGLVMVGERDWSREDLHERSL